MKTFKTLTAVAVALTLVSTNLHAQSFGGLFGKKEEDKPAENKEDLSDFDVSSPVEELAKKDVSKSKAVGQVIGGLIAGYACHKKLPSMPFGRQAAVAACAVGGATLGGPLGKYIGEAIAIRRLKYASEYEFLESEISASEKAIETRESELDKTKSDIDDAEKQIAELKNKEALTQADIAKAKSLKKETEAQLEENSLLADRYNDTLLYLNDTIKDSEENIASLKEDKQKTQQSLDNLKIKRDNLANQLAAIQTQSSRLEEQNSVLENLLAS